MSWVLGPGSCMQDLLSLLWKKRRIQDDSNVPFPLEVVYGSLSDKLREWGSRHGEDFDTALKYCDPNVHLLRRSLQVSTTRKLGGESAEIFWGIGTFYEHVDPREISQAILRGGSQNCSHFMFVGTQLCEDHALEHCGGQRRNSNEVGGDGIRFFHDVSSQYSVGACASSEGGAAM